MSNLSTTLYVYFIKIIMIKRSSITFIGHYSFYFLPISSMLDASNGNAKGHPLPPLLGQGPQSTTEPNTNATNENEPKEHKKKKRRKKKKHRETNEEISGEQPSEGTGNESKLIGDPASIEV